MIFSIASSLPNCFPFSESENKSQNGYGDSPKGERCFSKRNARARKTVVGDQKEGKSQAIIVEICIRKFLLNG